MVLCDVANTGGMAGAEVVQVYLRFPAAAGEPPLQLKGFQKVWLIPGQSSTVRFDLTNRSVSTWDVAEHAWQVQSGEYGVMVGASSADVRLQGGFTLP